MLFFFQRSKDDILDGRHRIEPGHGDVSSPGPGPRAGEDKPRVYDLPVTLDVIRGDTSNLLVVEVVVDVETETVKYNHLIADSRISPRIVLCAPASAGDLDVPPGKASVRGVVAPLRMRGLAWTPGPGL